MLVSQNLHETQNKTTSLPLKMDGFFQTIDPFLVVYGLVLRVFMLVLWRLTSCFMFLSWIINSFWMKVPFLLAPGALKLSSPKGPFLGLRWGAPRCDLWPEISGWKLFVEDFLPPKFPTQNVVGQELVHQFPIEKTANRRLGSEAICKKKSYRCSGCSQPVAGDRWCFLGGQTTPETPGRNRWFQDNRLDFFPHWTQSSSQKSSPLMSGQPTPPPKPTHPPKKNIRPFKDLFHSLKLTYPLKMAGVQ